MVVSVFMLTALSFGTMGSISVFLKPLSNEFGWTRANTAFGYTVASLGSAFFGIIWGYIADKYGTRLFGFFATFLWSLACSYWVSRVVYSTFIHYIFVSALLEMRLLALLFMPTWAFGSRKILA